MQLNMWRAGDMRSDQQSLADKRGRTKGRIWIENATNIGVELVLPEFRSSENSCVWPRRQEALLNAADSHDACVGAFAGYPGQARHLSCYRHALQQPTWPASVRASWSARSSCARNEAST